MSDDNHAPQNESARVNHEHSSNDFNEHEQERDSAVVSDLQQERNTSSNEHGNDNSVTSNEANPTSGEGGEGSGDGTNAPTRFTTAELVCYILYCICTNIKVLSKQNELHVSLSFFFFFFSFFSFSFSFYSTSRMHSFL